MKATKKKMIVCLLCAIGLVSCTNWQEKYTTELEKASLPIKGKLDFVKVKYDEVLEELDCEFYEEYDDVPYITLMCMADASWDATPKNGEWPEDVLVAHAFRSHDLGDVKVLFEKYDSFFDKEVDSKFGYEYNLNEFNDDVVRKIKEANYLVVIEDLVCVKPKNIGNGYQQGGYFDKLLMYDLNTYKLMYDVNVFSQNSDQIYGILDDNGDLYASELWNDLYKNQRNVIIAKVKELLP